MASVNPFCEWCSKARELGGLMCRPCYRKGYAPKVGGKPCGSCKRKPCSERKHRFIDIAQGPMPSGNQLNNNSYWWVKLSKHTVGNHAQKR